MMHDLKDKVAIVTGGERGIGRGISEEFLGCGMSVCIAGIDEDSANAFLDGAKAGNRLTFIKTDVGDESSVTKMVARTIDLYGRLDAVIANAALPDAHGQAVESLTLEDWDEIIRVNLTGCFLTAKHTFAELRKARGAMVLIASTRALQSEPDSTAYSASKGGIVALAHSLAMSGGPEIRVNAISPGWIKASDDYELTEHNHKVHPVGRVGRPSDIATIARYLISSEAGFITGQNFVVDGGMSRKMIYR